MASPLRLNGKELQKALIKQAQRQGWLCLHFPSVETKQGWRTPLAGDAKGWVDVFLLRERAVALEIKGDGDSLRTDQVKWGDALLRAGIEYHVIRPKEWRDGTVDRILT